jgi:hypothetical protein
MSARRRPLVILAVTLAVVVGGAGLAMAATGSGGGPAAAPQATGDPEGFIGINPVRVLDTRSGTGPIGVPDAAPLGAGQQIDLPLTTAAPNRPSAPVPANAVSVLLNITIDSNATS